MRDSKSLFDLTNEIPALQTEAEGKLRGGFSELTFEDIDLLADLNTDCSANGSCSGNGTCSDNGVCHTNGKCSDNHPLPTHKTRSLETGTVDCSDLSSFGGSVLF